MNTDLKAPFSPPHRNTDLPILIWVQSTRRSSLLSVWATSITASHTLSTCVSSRGLRSPVKGSARRVLLERSSSGSSPSAWPCCSHI